MCLEWNRSVPPRSSLFSFWRQGPIWSIGKTLIGGQNLGLLQYPVLDSSWTSFHPVWTSFSSPLAAAAAAFNPYVFIREFWRLN